MLSSVLCCEHLVSKLIFIVMKIRTRSHQPIADEVEFRRLMDLPESETDGD